jgi:hypothetical protein
MPTVVYDVCVKWWIVALATLAACYKPTFRDCTQACGPNSSCPPGLTCDNAVCRLPDNVGTSCDETAVDAEIPTADVSPENCTWALVSTNFAPVDVADTNPPAWDVNEDETFETGGVQGHAVAQTGGPNLWIVHVTRFTVATGVTLTLRGEHPLVIAADEIDVKGTIVVQNSGGDASCDAIRGANVCDAAAGGGGGGYGGTGGDGGGPPTSNGGSVSGVLPSPLRGGCPGAQGGDGRKDSADTTPRLGGEGGAGGGALQLSGRLSVNIEGTIVANGSSGLPGKSDPAGGGGCGLTGRASGGGGGGGGGTIFIESCATVIAPTAKLCASGGGGGGGAGGGSSNTGYIGQDGSCDARALGGPGEIAGSQGGDGGYDGIPAGPGAIAGRGGGGGGGAVGRIHVQQIAGAPVTAGATIRPPANRSQ